jgi:hypothetical protein
MVSQSIFEFQKTNIKLKINNTQWILVYYKTKVEIGSIFAPLETFGKLS